MAQPRARGDAQKVIKAVGPTPVENPGTAIVAVGAQATRVRRNFVSHCRRRQSKGSLPPYRAAFPGRTRPGRAALRGWRGGVGHCGYHEGSHSAMNRVEVITSVERRRCREPSWVENIELRANKAIKCSRPRASPTTTIAVRPRPVSAPMAEAYERRPRRQSLESSLVFPHGLVTLQRFVRDPLYAGFDGLDCQSASNFDARSASKIDPRFVTGHGRQRSPRRSWSGLRSRGERGLARSCCLDDQARFSKRQLSLPVSTMSQ